MAVSSDEPFKTELLHFAAIKGDLQKAKRLVREGNTVNAFDDLGKTPLHYAVERGHLNVAKFLLGAGADINAHDVLKAGNTPLGEVAKECSLETAMFLLEHGADPLVPGCMQLTALHRAEIRTDAEGPKIVRAMWDAIKRKV